MVRLNDHPNMTLAVYHGCEIAIQHNNLLYIKSYTILMGYTLYESSDCPLNPFQVLHRIIVL